MGHSVSANRLTALIISVCTAIALSAPALAKNAGRPSSGGAAPKPAATAAPAAKAKKAGKVKFQDFHVTKKVDKASP